MHVRARVCVCVCCSHTQDHWLTWGTIEKTPLGRGDPHPEEQLRINQR